MATIIALGDRFVYIDIDRANEMITVGAGEEVVFSLFEIYWLFVLIA
jgi:hypothetical protein